MKLPSWLPSTYPSGNSLIRANVTPIQLCEQDTNLLGWREVKNYNFAVDYCSGSAPAILRGVWRTEQHGSSVFYSTILHQTTLPCTTATILSWTYGCIPCTRTYDSGPGVLPHPFVVCLSVRPFVCLYESLLFLLFHAQCPFFPESYKYLFVRFVRISYRQRGIGWLRHQVRGGIINFHKKRHNYGGKMRDLNGKVEFCIFKVN